MAEEHKCLSNEEKLIIQDFILEATQVWASVKWQNFHFKYMFSMMLQPMKFQASNSNMVFMAELPCMLCSLLYLSQYCVLYMGWKTSELSFFHKIKRILAFSRLQDLR